MAAKKRKRRKKRSRILSQRPRSADTEAAGDGSPRWAVRSARGRSQGWPQKNARGARIGFCHRAHGARTQRKQETEDRGQRTGDREQRTEDRGRGTDFTGGNGENGGCFFIHAIRVIRGEKVWNVGRKKAQEAQESDFVTELTEG